MGGALMPLAVGHDRHSLGKKVLHSPESWVRGRHLWLGKAPPSSTLKLATLSQESQPQQSPNTATKQVSSKHKNLHTQQPGA